MATVESFGPTESDDVTVGDHTLHVPRVLVSTERPVVRNTLEDRTYAHSRSSCIELRPSVVHFDGYKVGEVHRQTVRILNVSSSPQRTHILPPQSPYFKIHYEKKASLPCGLSEDVTIEFRPGEWRYYYDCVRVCCQDGENLVIPVHAYPIVNRAIFPSRVDFKPCALTDVQEKTIPLRCEVPIDFDYEIAVLEGHPHFIVEPLRGTIPANSEAHITITHSPTSYTTASIKLQLTVAQFNFVPIVCVVAGSAIPGIDRPATPPDREAERVAEARLARARLQDPASIAQQERMRAQWRREREEGAGGANEATAGAEGEDAGLPVPTKMMGSQHAVSMLLSRAPRRRGKGGQKARDLREIVALNREDSLTTREDKEQAFTAQLRGFTERERSKELHWFVCVGDEMVADADADRVLAERAEAEARYRLKVAARGLAGDFPEGHNARHSNARTVREANALPAQPPAFDIFLNEEWHRRHSVLSRFVQCARRIVLRVRAQRRLEKIRAFIQQAGPNPTRQVVAELVVFDNRRVLSSKMGPRAALRPVRPANEDGTVAGDTQADAATPSDGYRATLAVSSVHRFTFPTVRTAGISATPVAIVEPARVLGGGLFVSAAAGAGEKERRPLAASGAEGASRGPISAFQRVNDPGFFELKVPQQYKLLDYHPHSVEDSMGYVAHERDRMLRTGAEDELFARGDIGAQRAMDAYVVDDPLPARRGLGAPQEYPSLHIFTPTPGVVSFTPALPFSEAETSHAFRAVKDGMDASDVVAGLMTWREQRYASLIDARGAPYLSDVWLPRWSDPFSDELVPHTVPELLDGLPEDDVLSDDSDSDDEMYGERAAPGAPASQPVAHAHLVPEMVGALFHVPGAAAVATASTKDAPPPVAAGPSLGIAASQFALRSTASKDDREAEFGKHLASQRNRLGAAVNGKVAALNTTLGKLKI